MSENIEQFDAFTVEYLNILYAQFPLEISISSFNFEEAMAFSWNVEVTRDRDSKQLEQDRIQTAARIDEGRKLLELIKLRAATLKWLHRTGFFTGELTTGSPSMHVRTYDEAGERKSLEQYVGTSQNVRFSKAVLTLKGLEVLRSVPESVDGKKNTFSIGAMAEAAGVDVAKDASSKMASSIVSAVVNTGARIPTFIAGL